MIQWFSSSLVRNLRPAHTCGGDNQLKWLPLYVRTLFRLFTRGVLAPPPMLLRNIIVTKVIAGLWAIFSFHLLQRSCLLQRLLKQVPLRPGVRSYLSLNSHTQKKKHHLGSDVLLWESSDLAGKSERHLILWPTPSSFLFTEKILPADHTHTHTEPEPGFNWSLQKPTTPLMRFRFQKSLALMLTLIQGSLL